MFQLIDPISESNDPAVKIDDQTESKPIEEASYNEPQTKKCKLDEE